MPSNAPLAWDEVDDGPLPWDEVTDAPHQASRTSQSGSFLPGSEIRTSEEAPTNFTTMVQAENESNRPATLPSTLTGGFMPLQGEGVNIGGAGSLSPFRYKKSTKADLAEEQAAIAKENEDVTPLSVTRSGNAYSSLLQIGQEQLGGALKSISKAASNNPGLFRRDDMAPFEEAEIARRQKMSGSQKWKEDVNQPLYTAGQALEQSAPESHPVIEPDSTAAGIGRAVGGFIPAIFAGEFAPVMFGLQAAGGVLDRAYQRNIDAGMDPDKAADEATKVALAEGTFQTLLMKFFPGQARKLGDAGIEKMLGTAMRQELKSKATRFAAGRAAQAVEGAGFGAASAAGSNLIQGNPIGEGMGESAKGMSIIQALTPRGGTPGEINAHNERVKNYISEVGRYEKENQRHQQREKLIAEEGEPTAQDRADLKQVKSEVEQGKRILTPETRAYIANLELKTSEPQIMQAEHEYQLHDEAAAENRPVSFGKLGSGEIAMRNRDGSIVVDEYELAKALAHLPTEKEKSDLIHRVVNEESVHGITNDSEALSFFLNGSNAERKLAAHRYYGDDFDPQKHNLNDPMQQTLIGHEMIRARIQEMQGLSPTEVAYMTGWGRDRSQGLLAMERAVFALRKFSNREGAKAQQGILDSVYSKLQKAREIAGKQAPQEADPFSVRPKSRSPEDAENRRKEQEARMASSREMMGMTTDQFRQFGVGGFNKQNVELGLHATPEHLAELKNLKDSVDPQYEKLLAKVEKTPEDLQKFADLASKRQYFNEAIKMAELKERENLTYDGKVGNRMQFTIRGGPAHDVQFTTADYASPDDIAAAKNRTVEQWSMPASRRPGESKQDELRRMAEEIRLRKLQAQGVELPPEHAAKLGLKAKDVTDLAPVASEDRVTAEQSGALPRLTGRNLEEHAAEVLRGEVNVRKIRESKAIKIKNEKRKAAGLPPISPKVRYKVPHFRDFSEWASNNLEGVKPHQVRQIWEDEVWKMLLNDEGPGIEKLRKGLGLEANYGTSKVAPPEKPVPEFQLEQGETRSEKKASKATREARQRYRNKLQAAIGLKLIGQSLEGRPSLERSSITIDDIDFSGGEGTNKENKYGPYTEINRHDLADPRRLLDILNDEARASSADSKSATRRLMAVVDHTNGKVYLVSTFNDAGVQRVTDPAGPSVKNKPNRELNKTFLNQYRPFASILIADPVKGFRQSFDSVSDFNERIGSEAAERSRIGEFPYPPEAKPDEDFAAEGTPGLEGEGGSFMGPSKQTLGVTTISGARDSRAKLTKAEAAAIYNHVRSEAGEMSTAEDVQASFEGLADKSQRGKLSAADHLALIAYRKIFAKLEALHPNDSTDTLMRDMTQILLQSRDASMSREGFANLLQSDFGESQAEPVSQPSKTARDLILPGGYRSEMHKAWRAASSNPMMPRTDIRPPTSQEQFSGPFQREAAPSSELGKTEGKPFIPSEIEEQYVPQRVRKFLESRKGPDYEADIDRAAHNRLVQAKLDKQIQEAKEMRARILRKQGKLMSYADAAKLVGYKGPMSRRPGAAREALEKFKEFARSPSIPAPEQVILDTSSPLPRFALNVDETMTKAMGIERIPLIGRLWGPRGRMRDAVDRALVGYSVKRNIGNSQAALIGSRMNALVEHLGHPFKQDENGRITNVKGDPKQSRFISDLFEDWQKQFVVPERMKKLTTINHVGREVNVYKPSDVAEYESKHPKTIELSKNQEAIFQEMYRFIKDGYEYLEEKNASLEKYRGESRESREAQHVMEGLPRGVEWYPFPRVALYKRSEGPVKSEIYRRIGGQYNIENERQYKTEQQGQPTTAYEPDMVKRLVVFAQRIYKAVADTDLVHNKALEGKTAEERVPILAKLHERELRSGEMNQERIHEMAQRPMLSTEGEVLGHPGFQGRIYPKKIADKINRALGSQQNHVVHAASEVSTMFKAFMLTGDLAQYLQQGAPMMFRRPKIWADATTKSIKSILDPNVTGRYLSNPENYKAATEFAQSGGSLGHLHDFMSGANPGEIATKIPGVRQMVERSGRAFGTFFDIAKVEMWKSLREGTPKDQWPQMVETIDNIVLSGKMEAAGVTPGRAAAERIVFMASAYYRGALQLVAGLAERGASGSEVRKVLGTYATGLTSLMVGSYLASGMSWQEIRRRLTPGRDNPKFLSYPVKIGNTTHEIGPGGIVLQLVGLGFDMASEAIQHPKKSWLGAKPLLNYLRTKLGPIPSMVMDAVTQKDAFGRPVHPGEAAVRMVTPVSAQQPINRLIGLANGSKSDIAGDVLDSTAGFVGVKSRLSSKMSEMSKLAAKFMEKNNLKKETGWDLVQNDEASYGQLRSAAIAGNQREFNRAYDALRETHKPQEIRQAMVDWLNRGFTGGKKYEDKFRHSLSPEDLKSYIEAKQEKKRIWAAFLTMKMKKK